MGNVRCGDGKSSRVTAGGTLRQHLFNHRARLRGSPGKRLLQKRRCIGVAAPREEQRAEILRRLS
jgi:hypothetical protein